MKTPEQITNSLVKEFDKLNDIREQSLKLSREIIKSCSKSIRNVHRNNLDEAKQHLDEANKFLSALTLLEDSKHITWHIVKHDFNEPLILTREVA